MLTEMWGEASIVGKMGTVLAAAPLLLSAFYAWRPTEARLALIRPLSLATVFAALASFAVGVAVILDGIAATPRLEPAIWQSIANGASETFVQIFVAFGSLTLTWLLVAVGLRRAG